MDQKHNILKICLFCSLGLTTSMAGASESHDHDKSHRQHGAHVHGIASLNVVLEGDEVHIELDSPAANIVGFEHAPSSAEDHAALEKAVETLEQGDRLFRFNDAAECSSEEAHITTELMDEHEHEEHEHEEHEHEEHEHDSEDGEAHSDIEAVYHFECAQPGKLSRLSVELFDAFAGMEKLNVQYVIEDKQGAAELTPGNHVIDF